MFGIYLTIVVLEFYLLYLCMIMNLFNDAKVMRHAFLILAHNEFQILKILLSMLASYDDFVKDLKYWNEQCRASKSKIVGGLPFYGYSWEESLQGAVDDVRGIRYSGILKHLGNEAADKDNIGKTYYNGRPTIANKCKFIKENDYAGVMIWQLFQDAHNDNYDLKLINVVGREMME